MIGECMPKGLSSCRAGPLSVRAEVSCEVEWATSVAQTRDPVPRTRTRERNCDTVNVTHAIRAKKKRVEGGEKEKGQSPQRRAMGRWRMCPRRGQA